MDNIHATHSTTGIVKNPVLVDIDMGRVLLAQLVDNVLYGAAGVVTVVLDAALRQVLEVIQLKDVKLVQVLLDNVDNRRQQRGKQAEDSEEARDGAASGLLVAGGGLFRSHCAKVSGEIN